MKTKGRRVSKNIEYLKGSQDVAPTIIKPSNRGVYEDTPNEKKMGGFRRMVENSALREKASVKEMKPTREDNMLEAMKNSSIPAWHVDRRLNKRKNHKESNKPGDLSLDNLPIDSDKIFKGEAKFLNPKKVKK